MSTNYFFWSHTLLKAISGGYGRLYNWFCTQPQQRTGNGYLYNGHVVLNSLNVSNTGFHVGIKTDFQTLIRYIQPLADYLDNGVGKILKESGWNHWLNTGVEGTNGVGWNGYGSGERNTFETGFQNIKIFSRYWTSTGDSGSLDYGHLTGSANFAVGNGTLNTKVGCSIRLMKDSTTLTNGQTGTYTGNDGRIYKTICIGTQEWLSENLAETKYRNGDLIPKVTDNTAWAALTTGAMCAYNNDEANAFETASIAPVGWHVPTKTEYGTLGTNTGILLSPDYQYSGGKLKETGLLHWNSPNTDATNAYGFNAIGNGWRTSLGDFGLINEDAFMYTASLFSGNDIWIIALAFDSNRLLMNNNVDINSGLSLRFIKDDSTFTPGDTVTDFDGNIYPLVKIGTQVWTATNWKCTKLNDGTPIPNITDNAEWAARTEMAQCIYDNNEANL